MLNEAERTRNALEALPQSTYAALGWPAQTVESCVKVVAEAQRMNNPRRVRNWIDVERSCPSRDELLTCLDAVLHQAILPGDNFGQRVKFANKLRQEAVDYLRSPRAITVETDAVVAKKYIADGLVSALGLQDPDLAEHSEATAELSARLAAAAGCDEKTVARAALAGRLHDIGKLRISRSIIAKPLPLTAAERGEIEQYPVLGADTLAALPALADIASIVRHHRERVDGRGYPTKMKADEIPLESRIVAIADTFHSLTQARAYRKALSLQDAVAVLLAGRGTEFDPNLVDIFADLVGYRARVARTA